MVVKIYPYLFIGEFSIYRVLAHLEPYPQFQRNLFNKLTSMTPQTNNESQLSNGHRVWGLRTESSWSNISWRKMVEVVILVDSKVPFEN